MTYIRLKGNGDLPYFADYSDDQVPIVYGPEYGNHTHGQFCDMMKPRFPVPNELREKFEEYLIKSLIPPPD